MCVTQIKFPLRYTERSQWKNRILLVYRFSQFYNFCILSTSITVEFKAYKTAIRRYYYYYFFLPHSISNFNRIDCHSPYFRTSRPGTAGTAQK